MPKYLIERDLVGAGHLTPTDFHRISATSCGVLQEFGPTAQWVQSYVSDHKIYCVYIAPNEALIREHARRGGIPANKVSKVRKMIDPKTAE